MTTRFTGGCMLSTTLTIMKKSGFTFYPAAVQPRWARVVTPNSASLTPKWDRSLQAPFIFATIPTDQKSLFHRFIAIFAQRYA